MGINVNSYSGNMYFERSDLYIEGRKLPMDITFFYNSARDTFNLGFGRGWSMQYAWRYETINNGIRIIRGDGFSSDFEQVTTNTYKAQAGVFDSLVKYSTSPVKFKLITKQKMNYFFENSTHKKVTRIEEINGNFLNFSYLSNHLTQISDAAGRAIQLQYNQTKGVLDKITDALASPHREIKYKYDGYNNLTEVEDPLGHTFKYDYIINGPMRRITDKNGNVADIIYSSANSVKEVITCNSNQRFSYDKKNGVTLMAELVSGKNQTTTFHYDSRGYIIRKKGNCCGFDTGFEYDNNGNVIKYKDANNNESTFTYDSHGNMLSKTDALGNTLIITYNSLNMVKSFTDKNGNTTSFLFDNKGNIIQANYPENTTNEFTFATNGDMLTSKDGNGNITTYTYDSYGNVQSIQKPLGVNYAATYDARSRLLSVTDPLNHSTTFTNDAIDRITAVTDAYSNSINIVYDNNNNVTSYTDRNNHTTTLTYDASDRLIKVTNALNHFVTGTYDERNNLTGFTDERGKVTQLKYDNLNQLTQVVNAANEVTQYAYAPNGKLINIVYPNGNNVTITRDARDQITQLSDNIGTISQRQYDAKGNLVSLIDGLGNAITFQYDGLHRLVKRTDPLNASEEYTYDKNFNILSYKDKNGHIKSVAYDALDRATTYTDALANVTTYNYDNAGNLTLITDAKGNETSYTYDNLNRQISTTYDNGIGRTAVYDNHGNVISYTDGNGVTTTYEYDAIDQLTKMDFPGADDYLYNYDAAGNLTSATNADAVVNFSYDAVNRIISETLNGRTTGYFYDIPNSLFGMQYPSGRNITKAFDARNRLTAIKEGPDLLFFATYDAANKMLTQLNGNGESITFNYDAGGRLLSKFSNSIPTVGFEYTYDNSGNKLTEKKTHKPDHSEQYIYDNEDQLIEFKYGTLAGNTISNPSKFQKFNYDPLGNRIIAFLDTDTLTYTTNSLNQYTQISGNSSTAQTFDNNGNLITSGADNYSYNTLDQLANVNNTSLKYDALNRLIEVAGASDSTNYDYSFLNPIEMRKPGNNISNVYGKGLDDLINLESNGLNYFAMKNNVNSVTSLTDNTNHVIEFYEYEAFGTNIIFNNAYALMGNSLTGNELQFGGRNKITTDGFYNFRFRYLDTEHGKFTQRDPLEYVDGMNIYLFVKNNSINLQDNLGLFKFQGYCENEIKLIEYQLKILSEDPVNSAVFNKIKEIGDNKITFIKPQKGSKEYRNYQNVQPKFNKYYFIYSDIYYDPNDFGIPYPTSMGISYHHPATILLHELGHLIYGPDDENELDPVGDNVRNVERPWQRSRGYPERTRYELYEDELKYGSTAPVSNCK